MSYMFNLESYETVAERVLRFQKQHINGRITTKIITLDNAKGEVLAMAEVYRKQEDTEPAGVDYAFGIAATYPQSMRKFYVEDTVTSAVGRALSLVLDTDKKPTREDMQKVQAHNEVEAKVEEVKAKMAETSQQYVPVAKESDPWTTWASPAPQTMEQAVETVKQVLGGTTADESCVHGARIWKTGTSKANKPWGHWRCPAQATRDMPGGEVPCDPIWYEIAKDGSWQKRAA
jgi:hypothetical protein